MTETKEVMVCAELSEHGLGAISRELSTLGRRLADELKGVASAILIGNGIKDLAGELYQVASEQSSEPLKVSVFLMEKHWALLD